MTRDAGKPLGNAISPATEKTDLPKTTGKCRKRKPESDPTSKTDDRSPYAKLLSEPLLRRLSAAATAADSFLRRNDLLLLPSQCLSLEALLSSLPISPSPSSSFSSTAWFHRFLSSASSDDGDPRWHHCFRMSRPTFLRLLSSLSPPPEEHALAAAIFRLAHGASYKSVARRFGFSSSADASRAFYTVCKLINEKLGEINKDDPKPDFSPRSLLNCCGVLGFARFEIDGELLGPNGSILVQALVDSTGRFVDISAGWPSTIKPETIFRQTKLFSVMEAESRSFLNGPSHKLGNGVYVPQYIVGDSRFPLLPWLMTPYSSSSNEEEDSFESCRSEFNNAHKAVVRKAGTAFASVRDRWRILDRKWKQEMVEFLPFVITTCCLLHNFLVSCGENAPDNNAGDSGWMWMRDDEEEEEETREFREEDLDARRIRDAIAENLSRVCSRR
ncbi:PREDICTED: putative nuclease HARBI1 [Tarenaya hassleriana]|uniref:putative nuclease HARBI1 n=1 Tax=Tarenaya hassleriana TaxID=28532 RepID=UPI00053C72C2|nr:PREDICTED: putative nuclease HARBI1 [Tarenaya hassleriana]